MRIVAQMQKELRESLSSFVGKQPTKAQRLLIAEHIKQNFSHYWGVRSEQITVRPDEEEHGVFHISFEVPNHE